MICGSVMPSREVDILDEMSSKTARQSLLSTMVVVGQAGLDSNLLVQLVAGTSNKSSDCFFPSVKGRLETRSLS